MSARYIPLKGFTAVLTPHFIISAEKRGMSWNALTDAFMENLYAAAAENVVSGTAFDGGFIYFRVIWNSIRRRGELEFISFTPARHFTTANHQHTVRI